MAFFKEIHGILMRFFAEMLRKMHSRLCKNFRIFGEQKIFFFYFLYEKNMKINKKLKIHGKLVLIDGNALICPI